MSKTRSARPSVPSPSTRPMRTELAKAVRAAAAEVQLAGEAAAKAMHAAIGAAWVWHSPDSPSLHTADAVAGNAAAAADFASKVASYVSRAAQQDFDAASDSDYEGLLERDLGHFPDLGRPVDPAESGPLGALWPDGEPAWIMIERLKAIAMEEARWHFEKSGVRWNGYVLKGFRTIVDMR